MSESVSSSDFPDELPGVDSSLRSTHEPHSEMSNGAPCDTDMIQGTLGVLVVLAMVALADICLYHAEGFSGPAAFLVGAAGLVFIGIPRRALSRTSFVMSVLLVVASLRLAWSGSSALVLSGMWLLCGFTLALRKRSPFVLETLVFAAQCIPGGYGSLSALHRGIRSRILDPLENRTPSRHIEFLLPVVATVVFGGIFVMANPDMVSYVSVWIADALTVLKRFFFQFSLSKIAFWFLVAWLTGGLLRPLAAIVLEHVPDPVANPQDEQLSPLYQAYRNTLITVVVIFAAYLLFEFRAFLTRKPPEGFTYSSYAHEGAAWLTVALGLATLTLSLIFRGRLLLDPRRGRLQALAWCWSGLNVLLALAVYNRMFIYVEFNGMTRMRTVALLGITSVVLGFALVIVKIVCQREFLWLVRRQLWVVALAVYVYLVLPVDVLIHRYNVKQILGGNPAPVVQITHHPVTPAALPELIPLCESQNELISTGIQAMLSLRFQNLTADNDAAEELGWTAWQKANRDVASFLDSNRQQWDKISGHGDRIEASTRLKNFAFHNWW